MQILAMGGGELRLRETLALDQELVRMAGKPKPNALFIPTASGDPPEYVGTFNEIYGGELGCETMALLLHSNPVSQEVAEKIGWADLVYVGGGNTKMMLQIWRERGVDRLLREAGERGAALGGLSAGAICWFQVGCSDWPLFEGSTDRRTGPIEGLGFVAAAACPHTVREEHRLDDFKEMMREVPLTGLGLDDLCGLQISGAECRVLSGGALAGVQKLRWVWEA
jgi:dipeptidase E